MRGLSKFALRHFVEPARNLAYRGEIARFAALRGRFAGKTLILVGNGPSLRRTDLSLLDRPGLFVMTVNKGFAVPGLAGRTLDFHCVSDIHAYRLMGAAVEAAPIVRRFYRTAFIRDMTADARRRPGTYFVPVRRGGLLKRGFDPRIEHGLGNDSSVLVFAAQVAYHLGFATVAVIGCDLDYDGPDPYAYAMSEADVRHEGMEETRRRRAALKHAQAELAILAREYERAGRRLVNAGVGGRLDALARLPLSEIAKAASDGARPGMP